MIGGGIHCIRISKYGYWRGVEILGILLLLIGFLMFIKEAKVFKTKVVFKKRDNYSIGKEFAKTETR